MDLTRSLYISLTHTHTHVNIYMRDGFEISQINHEEKAFKTVKKKKKNNNKRKKKIVRIIISKELKKSVDLSCNLNCSVLYCSFGFSKTRIQS